MQLLSIQVGKIQTHIMPNGSEWKTAYYKEPVVGRVFVNHLHVEGDDQKHKKFHGGEHRPILMYSAEHYTTWKNDLALDLPYGAFSENFTVSGVNEDTVCIGDVYQVGDTLRIQVSQPRVPCNQIDQRWNRPDLRKEVARHYRTGWYLRVLQEGYAEANMPLTLLERSYPQWTIRTALSIYENRHKKVNDALQLATCEALEPNWRTKLGEVVTS